MLHAGLDPSSRRLDVHLMDDAGVSLLVDAFPTDSDGLAHLARELYLFDADRVNAVIESMNGAPSSTTRSSSPAGTWRSPTHSA